jgi:thioredoxin-dependent peroxiredoxin
MLAINQPAPDFSLAATDDKILSLDDFMGKNVILYFYPKDCTSGCTQEGRDFAEHYKKFASLNTVILGVSRDTLRLHKKFKEEQQFPFELLSDAEQKLCETYGVLKEKTIYGKKTRGIERSTFLIDKEGLLRQAWRNVQVSGHVQAVLQAVAELD